MYTYIYIYPVGASRGGAPPKKPLSLGLVYTSLLRLSFPPSPPLPSSPLFSSFGEERGRRNRLSYPLRFPADLGCTEARTSNGTSIGRDGGGAINNDSRDENGDSTVESDGKVDKGIGRGGGIHGTGYLRNKFVHVRDSIFNSSAVEVN